MQVQRQVIQAEKQKEEFIRGNSLNLMDFFFSHTIFTQYNEVLQNCHEDLSTWKLINI